MLRLQELQPWPTQYYSGCVTSCPSYLSGRLLLCELLCGALSEPELCRPRLLFLKKGRQPELASGSGAMSCLRSGLGVLFGPNTLSSWEGNGFSQHLGGLGGSGHTYFEHLLLYDLLLPGDGDGASAELAVEVLVSLVETDALHGGELLDIQNILERQTIVISSPATAPAWPTLA